MPGRNHPYREGAVVPVPFRPWGLREQQGRGALGRWAPPFPCEPPFQPGRDLLQQARPYREQAAPARGRVGLFYLGTDTLFIV